MKRPDTTFATEEEGRIDVYMVNTEVSALIFYLTAGLIAITFGQSELRIREGGWAQFSSLDTFVLYGAISAYSLMIFYCVWRVIAEMRKYWPYTVWNRKRRPFLSYTNSSLIVFSEIVLPWCLFSDALHQTLVIRTKYVTYLVLELKDRAAADELADHQRKLLTRFNLKVLRLRPASKALPINGFFSIRLDERCGLSWPSEDLLELAKTCVADSQRKVAPDAVEMLRSRLDLNTRGNAKSILRNRFPIDRAVIFRDLFYVISSGFLFLICAWHFLPDLRYELEALHWPSADAVIVKASNFHGCRDSGNSRLALEYTFNDAGNTYQGYKMRMEDLKLLMRVQLGHNGIDLPVGGNACQSERTVISELAEYPVGKHVVAYFEPADPNQSVLVKPSMTMPVLFQMGLIAFLFILNSFFLASYAKIFVCGKDVEV